MTSAVGHDELVRRAGELIPRLRVRAARCEAERTLPAETIADFIEAGFLEILRPVRFGGQELGLGTLTAVAREVARACGSSVWCLALFGTNVRLVGLFEERAQQEVFAGPARAALVTAAFAPTETAAPTEEAGQPGFRVAGRWRFASGCDHAAWAAVAATVARRPAPPIADVRMFLVPAGEFRIHDTWHAMGLRGSGSKDVVVEGCFVPAHRTLAFLDVALGRAPGARLNTSPLFRLPLLPTVALAAAGPAIGLAHQAIEGFREWVGAGGPTRSHVPLARQAATHMRYAEATVDVDAAQLLLDRAVEQLCQAGAAAGPPSRAAHARARLGAAFVVSRCAQAADRLLAASGAGAVVDAVALQRAFRDLHTLRAHGALRFDTAAELFGRTEFGLPPNTVLV